jgi:hypothetical protein
MMAQQFFKIAFLVLSLSNLSGLFAQNSGVAAFYLSKISNQTVNFTTFMEEMANHQPDIKQPEWTVFEIIGTKVRFDDADILGMDKRFMQGGKKMIVEYDIDFANIDFDQAYWFALRNVEFKQSLKLTHCKNVKIIFKDCVFENTLRINANDADFFKFENCQFKNGLMYHFNKVSEYISFQDCTFAINPDIKDNTKTSILNPFEMEHHLFQFFNKTEPFDLIFKNCKFLIPKELENEKRCHINIVESNFKNLRFENNVINTTLNLSSTTVENQFQLEEGSLKGKIIIDAININPQNARVEWSVISGQKISVFNKDGGILDGSLEIKYEKIYNRLVGCYSTFYQVFKSQGNRFYANNCYIEWKNIETEYLGHNYQQNKDSQVYFIYLMNLFLRDFCSYGTDPLKSIYLSAIVILGFAFLYFISPFKNDYKINENGNSRQNFYTHLQMLTLYFLKNDKLTTIYTENTQNQGNLTHLKTAKETYKLLSQQHKHELPFYFSWLGASLLPYSHHLSKKIYLWLDKFPEKWDEMSKFKRHFASIFFAFVIVGLFFYFIFIRIIDSVALSLNVFSTLGFGDIPITGFIRYLTILEGFIGWFLLSIFSVCLISQIIQ